MNDQYKKYQSEGVLFVNNDKQKESHPDMRGHITVTPNQVKRLVAMGKAGQEPRLQVAAWDRVSRDGDEYIYMKTEAYLKQEKSEQQSSQQGDWEDDDIPF